jgi:serine/threonine protein phosphatase 1
MKYLIIGDVHGCYYTMKDLLKGIHNNYDRIIFVGDLIDRGKYSAEVYLFCRDLVENGKALVLKGNHERIYTNHFSGKKINKNWEQHEGGNTIRSFNEKNINPIDFQNWADDLPLCYFTDHFIVSHAGLCDTSENREIVFDFERRNDLLRNVDQDADKSMLWSRDDVMKLHIPQIHGHTPMPNAGPLYCSYTNVYNVDTGACFGWFLSAVEVNKNTFKPIFVKTNPKDIAQ